MTHSQGHTRILTLVLCLTTLFGLTACNTGGQSFFGVSRTQDNPFAPGINQSKDAQDGIEVAHRLMQAGEFEQFEQRFTPTNAFRS